MGLAEWLLMAAGGVGAIEPEAVDFGQNDYLSGQSFTGAHLEFDVYYVSGTMPFGLPQSPKNTWSHIDLTGSYTVANIGQNFIGRMANLKLDAVVDMPMHDPATCHINDGTGDNFVQNGVIGRSQRGPNQWNCVNSKFNGTSQFLRSTDIGASNSNAFTLSFDTLKRDYSNGNHVFNIRVGTSNKLRIQLNTNLTIVAVGETGTTLVVSSTPDVFELHRNYHVDIDLDTTDINNTVVLIDNEEVTFTPSVFVSGNMLFDADFYEIGLNSVTNEYVGSIGEVWFDTQLTGLSSNNPHHDPDTNRPKPVRQVIEETGHTPLIAMPIRADIPGKNYGTAGDFTEFSAPFVGARGASEYFSRSVVVDSSNYLTGNIYCESLVKWKSVDGGTTWIPTYANAVTVTNIGNGTDNGVVCYYWGTSEDINWSLEENRLRVTDGLGFPVDMDQVLSDNPNSVLALDFSDPDNLGNNKAGSNFIITGNLTQGVDVNV